MKRIIMLCVMAVVCTVVSAQNKISGKITDLTGQPLPGATILLPEINKTTSADSAGNYSFFNLPGGKTTIQVSFIGFENKVDHCTLTGRPITFNCTLHPVVTEAEEIVVTGGYSSTQHDNAVKIEVLKLQPTELKATPNFMETLTKVPGVDMISKGSGVSKPVIRGLAMNDILVLNNNVRFENYQYSNHHPLGIDEFGIQDVEIIKGPASLLYGSDAIGGVVNFIREKPAAQNTITGDYNLQLFSNTLGVTNNIGIKGASTNWFGGIRLGHKTNADFLQGGGNYAANTRFNGYSVKANVGYTSNTGSFQLFYDYSQYKLGLAEEEAIEAITNRGRKCELLYQQLNTHLLSSQNKIYLGKMKLDVNAAFQNTALAHLGQPGQYELEMGLRTITYETKLHLPSDNKSEYILGLQGMNQTNKNLHNRETILLPNATTENYSAFGLFQHTFFERLKLQTGIRYDYRILSSDQVGEPSSTNYRTAINKEFGSFSGSLGATWHLSEDMLFRANMASAFRSPNLAELTSNGQHEERFEKGDNNLVPEKSWEGDLGLHYHILNLTIDISCFYNRVNHFIYIAPTGNITTGGLPVFQYMQNNSRLFGGEAGIHFHPKSIEWLHLEVTFSTVTGLQDNGNYLPFIPANKLNLEARAEKPKLLFLTNAFVSIRESTSFSQDNPAPEESATSGYSLTDISLGGIFKFDNQPVEVSVSATNLLDKKYIDHLSTLKEVGFYDPGRNIALIVKVPF